MDVHGTLTTIVSEELAAAWWLRRYTGSAERIIRAGKINRAGTPLFDTNWLPSLALLALVYREQGKTITQISKTIGKSWHAVSDLFQRVDQWELPA